jgi:hypothetical protein
MWIAPNAWAPLGRLNGADNTGVHRPVQFQRLGGAPHPGKYPGWVGEKAGADHAKQRVTNVTGGVPQS